MPVRDNIFAVNTLGMLEIFPKPSGMTVFGHPTMMTTHAVKDEYIKTGPEYDHAGCKLLDHDDGCECIVITNAMRGGYMQIGLQPRDPYTRRDDPPYVPPNARSPPRPWSIRVKEPKLQPVEICYTRTAMSNVFLGKEGDDTHGYTGKDVVLPSVAAPVMGHGSSIGPVSRVTIMKPGRRYRLRKPGDITVIQEGITPTQDFIFNVRVVSRTVLKEDFIFSEFYPSCGILGDKFLDDWKRTYCAYSAGTIVGAQKSLPSPISPDAPMYKNVYDTVHWRYPTPSGETRPNRAVVYYSSDGITRYASWSGDTEVYHPHARELPMDWLMVRGSVAETPFRRETSRPALFVPHMFAFKPRKAKGGPIDFATGRRMCEGDCLIGIITTSELSISLYGTHVSFLLNQVTRPITNAPIFRRRVDLSNLLGIEIGDDKRLAKQYEAEAVANALEEERKENEKKAREEARLQVEEEIIA